MQEKPLRIPTVDQYLKEKKTFPQDTGEWSIFMYSFKMPKTNVCISIIPSN